MRGLFYWSRLKSMASKWLTCETGQPLYFSLLGRVDLCCTFRVQQYIGSHINMNASDNMLA